MPATFTWNHIKSSARGDRDPGDVPRPRHEQRRPHSASAQPLTSQTHQAKMCLKRIKQRCVKRDTTRYARKFARCERGCARCTRESARPPRLQMNSTAQRLEIVTCHAHDRCDGVGCGGVACWAGVRWQRTACELVLRSSRPTLHAQVSVFMICRSSGHAGWAGSRAHDVGAWGGRVLGWCERWQRTACELVLRSSRPLYMRRCRSS